MLVLGGELADFPDPVEPGEGLADLRPDIRDAHERRRHHADEEDVHHEIAERHRPGQDGAAADHDEQHADQPDEDRREGRNRVHAADAPGDVPEEPVHAARKDELLAAFCRVGLHQPDTAHGLREAARHFGIDLAALAEDRPEPLEGDDHPGAEDDDDDERDGGELPVEPEEHAERERGREEATDELKPGPYPRGSAPLRRRS